MIGKEIFRISDQCDPEIPTPQSRTFAGYSLGRHSHQDAMHLSG
jgi:hypothetical protein